jgi:hypothetical protein
MPAARMPLASRHGSLLHGDGKGIQGYFVLAAHVGWMQPIKTVEPR